jgi:plastocyanin
MALAGFLQADLAARGVVAPEVRSPRLDARDSSKSSNTQSSNIKASNNDGINIQQSTGEEIIVIWVNQGGGAATSTVTQTKTVTQAAGVAAATGAAVTHQVTVGGAAGLVYSPDTIEAAVGDMVVFTFDQQNHTVTQSAFNTPCVKLDGGMNSGFMANINNTISPAPQMAMQVTVATPLWFYCAQVGHCGKGMTFSINPTAAKTQAMFQQMAIQQNGTGTASPIVGGSASSAVVAATATSVATAAGATSTGTSIVAGTGTDSTGGACTCSCLCGVEAFPNAAAQGVANFGGMTGAIPMALLEK